MASEEIAEPEERSDGLGVLRHVPVVGMAQLVWVHLLHPRLDVEAHYRSIDGPQASSVGVHLQLMLLQKGKDTSQVLGMLLPGSNSRRAPECRVVCQKLS